MNAVVDRYLDREEDSSFLFDWLMSILAFSMDCYNMTCKEVYLLVEGLTPDGKPLLNKEN